MVLAVGVLVHVWVVQTAAVGADGPVLGHGHRERDLARRTRYVGHRRRHPVYACPQRPTTAYNSSTPLDSTIESERATKR